MESSTDSTKKFQRIFPPTDIRDEALSVPTVEKSQPSSQKDSSIQSNSSITIERIAPKPDITKPKVKTQGEDNIRNLCFELSGIGQCHTIFMAKICSSARRIRPETSGKMSCRNW